MFEEARRTGNPEAWYAVPDGYAPEPYGSRRVAGDAQSLAMFREVNGFLSKLPDHNEPQAVLLVYYHPDHLKGSQGRAIRRELDAIRKNGGRAGVYVYETGATRKR